MEHRLEKLCIIDRFEGDYAVIEFEGKDTFDFPKALLPETVREGDVLHFAVTVDQEKTEQRRKEIEELTSSLFRDEE